MAVFTESTAILVVSAEMSMVADFSVFGAQLQTDGISSFTLELTLARNALVRSYPIVIRARRASATAVNTVAQVRATPSTDERLSPGTSIVLDFGTPRTISAVSVPSGLGIVRVTPWMGTGFGPEAIFSRSVGNSVRTAILPSEVRTERLMVEASGALKNGNELASEMAVVLPEAPSDLEVRIDGGPPVVTLPGPAQPGADASLNDRAWNKDGERIVDLADALGKLVGDPTKSGNVTFKVVLTSRVPGELSMRARTPVLSYVRRVTFGAETSKELVFTDEGSQTVPLENLPAPLTIEDISFNVAGTLPPERVIPPVGPDDAGLAELIIDAERVVCVRLRSGTGLGELTGIRLPLRAGPGGAEMRIVLWSNKEGGVEPNEAMPEAVSEPVEVSDANEAWTTFSFKRPVPINAQNPPWAVVSASRGEVTYSLGASTGAADPLHLNVIRRGAPTGPFKSLPTLFQSTTGFGLARGRVRVIGHAPKDAVLAPLIVSIPTHASSVEVSPVAKGTPAKLSFASPVAVTSPTLQVISRIGGTVTLRDIDVVSTT